MLTMCARRKFLIVLHFWQTREHFATVTCTTLPSLWFSHPLLAEPLKSPIECVHAILHVPVTSLDCDCVCESRDPLWNPRSSGVGQEEPKRPQPASCCAVGDVPLFQEIELQGWLSLIENWTRRWYPGIVLSRIQPRSPQRLPNARSPWFPRSPGSRCPRSPFSPPPVPSGSPLPGSPPVPSGSPSPGHPWSPLVPPSPGHPRSPLAPPPRVTPGPLWFPPPRVTPGPLWFPLPGSRPVPSGSPSPGHPCPGTRRHGRSDLTRT